MLTVVDDCTRNCPTIKMDTAQPDARVVRELECLRETRGLPEEILTDNKPEFTRRALDTWAYGHGAEPEESDQGRGR